ncbi:MULTISPECIES: sporulation protein YqfC [Evansella]|jgi:sporulation protein YqfC|uniref:sporulation protein YqfC n=1 Tax=Evansella TaxID=2837485 RepID=UPI0009978CA9|nr:MULTISPECIES: sporulation protein YqfC [Evansella]UTR09355.1 sporulation protein YqfC [Evansella sp. LMS18]
MKRIKKRVRRWMTEQMDLPADVMMDLPRITMIGNFHIYIENHKGVIRFTREELRLRLTEGELLVSGNAFVIKNILPEEILLEGEIQDVRFIKK